MTVDTGDIKDEDLARRVQGGDTESFGILVGRFEPKLLRYGRKFLSGSEDIEDIVQDVFVSAYQNIQSFDAERAFSPWIYRIAHNAFVGELRKRSRHPVRFFGFDFDTFVPHPVHEKTREPESEQAEMRTLIEKGLSKIPSSASEILILHYLEDLSYAQIADVLRIPIGTVSVRLMRAKQALKLNAAELKNAYD